MYLPSTDLVEIMASPWSGCSWFFHNVGVYFSHYTASNPI